jgi:hypothetical protein
MILSTISVASLKVKSFATKKTHIRGKYFGGIPMVAAIKVFVHGKPFQPSLISVCIAGTYNIEEPFRCSTIGQATGLANKQKSRLERLAMHKHSSLLQNL